MKRLSWGIALSITAATAAVAAGCKDDPPTFTDAGPGVDAAPETDAALPGQCGDGIRTAGEFCHVESKDVIIAADPQSEAQLGDIDADGDDDLLYLAGGELRWHENTARGLGTGYNTGFVGGGNLMRSRDLDGDGAVDLLVGSFDQIAVWRSFDDPAHSHELGGSLAASADVRDVIFADLDGTGRPEVIGLSPSHLTVGVLAADLTLTAGLDGGVEGESFALAAGRFDADTRDDVLVANTGGVFFLPGTAAGGLGELVELPISQPYDLVTGDFDGDGTLDFAYAAGNLLGVVRGNGDGTFQAATTHDNPWSSALAVGDLDGDHRDDVLSLDGNQMLRVWLGRADGTLALAQTVLMSDWANSLSIGGDLNGDGVPEITFNNGESSVVFFMYSNP